jgi:endo-1,4-beta-xylanase
LLFYNDYNTENNIKRDKIYQLVKGLVEKGVPIHGVGLQAHWSLNEPTAEALEESIVRFSGLGLKVQITELDISVHPKQHEKVVGKYAGVSVFTKDMETQQIEQYKMIFNIFRKHKDKITGVTFWNLSDKSTWLDKFPVEGRKDYPLLFDVENKPKKAYWGVVKF